MAWLSGELLARQRLDDRHREGDLARLAAIARGPRPAALKLGARFGWPPRRRAEGHAAGGTS